MSQDQRLSNFDKASKIRYRHNGDRFSILKNLEGFVTALICNLPYFIDDKSNNKIPPVGLVFRQAVFIGVCHLMLVTCKTQPPWQITSPMPGPYLLS